MWSQIKLFEIWMYTPSLQIVERHPNLLWWLNNHTRQKNGHNKFKQCAGDQKSQTEEKNECNKLRQSEHFYGSPFAFLGIFSPGRETPHQSQSVSLSSPGAKIWFKTNTLFLPLQIYLFNSNAGVHYCVQKNINLYVCSKTLVEHYHYEKFNSPGSK